MKRKLSALAIPALIALVTIPAFSQKYKTAAGVRIENGLNLTVQQYITNGWTAEGILHTPAFSDVLGVTVMGEKHHKIIFRGTNFYTGAGMHYYWKKNIGNEVAGANNNIFGVSGVAGLEFTLGRINLAVDWKPELHLAGEATHAFSWNGASISARYIIEKREKKTIKDWKVWDKFGKKKK